MKKKSEDNGITQVVPVIEIKVACLEQSIVHIHETLNRMEKRLDSIDSKFTDVMNEIKDVRKEMKYDFRFLVTIICGLSAVMAHGFHWF